MKLFKNYYIQVIFISSVIICGCQGIKFNNCQDVFIPPSQSFKERSIWTDASIIQYKLQALFGYIITKSDIENKYKRVIQILPNNYTPNLEPITEGEFYHSLINSDFATKISGNIPILSVAADLQATQMMEITILDKCLIYMDDNNIPWDKLKDYVKTHPKKNGNDRFWVQAVMLTQMLSKTATTCKSNETVSGSAYQVNGQTYNAGETQNKTPYITMLLIDIDQIDTETKAMSIINDIKKLRVSKRFDLPFAKE
jgi:hypothetical protein